MEIDLACPVCTMTEVLTGEAGDFECATCGHEWTVSTDDGDGLGAICDANGAQLHNGDTVVLIKQLPLKGTDSIKIGTKVTNIRLIAGDHEIDCKIAGRGVLLKAKFVKKA